MPFYDYIYNTMDNSTDELYERTVKGTEEMPDVVHLTHMTTLQSTYHLRIGIASIASRPSDNPVWYMWMIWPMAWLSMVLAWVYGSSAFVIESLKLNKLKMQTWAIPRYNFQVMHFPFHMNHMLYQFCKVPTFSACAVRLDLGERIYQQVN
jgi:aldehyde decarbonylase